ncbi:maleylacetate reductase [Massilia niastensis]|uniref:maleylacetate reductase n=1 Tax=Massilia niastensis TaxID=544911 RepID=UPI0003800A8E|nr:maleylacetate reductase [Massilia niastensis]
MTPFVHTGHAQRVVFGAGSLGRLEEEVDMLKARKVLVLSTAAQREQAERIGDMLGARAAGIFDGAVMHVPIETARAARDMAASLNADCAVAIGGGSTIGLGKAIALESALPILAIPTTYAGSEMTPIYGLTQDGLKRTGKDTRVMPRTVIYDPDLSAGLPAYFSLVSGINAIAHAAEGLYAFDANPITHLMAREGIAAFGRSLPAIARLSGEGGHPDLALARSDAMYGTWLCGTVLGSVSMGLHHKLCHTLGGSFKLPHAEVHTVILPHALAYNAAAAPQAMEAIASALDAGNAARAIFDLARDNGAPVALRDIGMTAGDLDRACEIAMQNQYPNPRPLDSAAIRKLLQDAYEGIRP